MSKKNKIIKISFYILLASFFIIFSIEITLRILGYTYSTPHIMYDKYCYWRMAPNQKMHFKDPYGNAASITINSLGARGKEFQIEKLPGEKRIICLGDSYTYGLGVDDAQTYSAYLQNLLNNSFSNVEVINFGCNGHTILQEVNFLKQYGAQLQPDYVILGTSLNTDFRDIDELHYNIGYMPVPGYNFIKYCIRKTAIGNIMLKHWNSKKVKDIIRHREQIQQMINKGSSDLLSQEKKTSKQKSTFEIYIDKLDELVKLGDENNIKIIYVIMPLYSKSLDEYKIESVYRGKDLTAREYYEFLKSRYGSKITLIELMSYFGSEDLFLPDKHLNARGNRLAAEIIYKAIKIY